MAMISTVKRVKVLLAVDVPAFRAVDTAAEFDEGGALDAQSLLSRIKAGADAGRMKDFSPDWEQITGLRVVQVSDEAGTQLAEDLRIQSAPVDAGMRIERAILDARIDPIEALTEAVRFCCPALPQHDIESAIQNFIARLIGSEEAPRRIQRSQHR